MGSFLRNLQRSGLTVHSHRYSARGALAVGFQGPQTILPGAPRIGAGLRQGNFWRGGVRMDLRIRFPLPTFITAWNAKEQRVLFKSGRYAMRTYRSQLRRPPPKRLTKTGKIFNRYQREIINKEERPPYKRTGILKNSVDFSVDLRAASFISGPPLITGRSKFVKAAKPVPQLLDEGGPAQVTFSKGKGKRKINKNVMYRRFPYRNFVFRKTTEFMKKKLGEEQLREQ